MVYLLKMVIFFHGELLNNQTVGPGLFWQTHGDGAGGSWANGLGLL
jgi:hypothetical protein